MPEVFSSPLEDDIRRRANGGEKAVFAQRNPLTEMYPNAEYRNFEQEKEDECLEVSRQPRQTKCSYSFLQGMCGLHAEPGAKKRKPGSGGKFKAASSL